jgi:hypothetical protein
MDSETGMRRNSWFEFPSMHPVCGTQVFRFRKPMHSLAITPNFYVVRPNALRSWLKIGTAPAM